MLWSNSLTFRFSSMTSPSSPDATFLMADTTVLRRLDPEISSGAATAKEAEGPVGACLPLGSFWYLSNIIFTYDSRVSSSAVALYTPSAGSAKSLSACKG